MDQMLAMALMTFGIAAIALAGFSFVWLWWREWKKLMAKYEDFCKGES